METWDRKSPRRSRFQIKRLSNARPELAFLGVDELALSPSRVNQQKKAFSFHFLALASGAGT